MTCRLNNRNHKPAYCFENNQNWQKSNSLKPEIFGTRKKKNIIEFMGRLDLPGVPGRFLFFLMGCCCCCCCCCWDELEPLLLVTVLELGPKPEPWRWFWGCCCCWTSSPVFPEEKLPSSPVIFDIWECLSFFPFQTLLGFCPPCRGWPPKGGVCFLVNTKSGICSHWRKTKTREFSFISGGEEKLLLPGEQHWNLVFFGFILYMYEYTYNGH